jgi:hypothetical protein
VSGTRCSDTRRSCAIGSRGALDLAGVVRTAAGKVRNHRRHQRAAITHRGFQVP